MVRRLKTLSYIHIFGMYFEKLLSCFAGLGELQKPETTVKELLNDTKRVRYMSGYLGALRAAMRYHNYN